MQHDLLSPEIEHERSIIADLNPFDCSGGQAIAKGKSRR